MVEDRKVPDKFALLKAILVYHAFLEGGGTVTYVTMNTYETGAVDFVFRKDFGPGQRRLTLRVFGGEQRSLIVETGFLGTIAEVSEVLLKWGLKP